MIAAKRQSRNYRLRRAAWDNRAARQAHSARCDHCFPHRCNPCISRFLTRRARRSAPFRQNAPPHPPFRHPFCPGARRGIHRRAAARCRNTAPTRCLDRGRRPGPRPCGERGRCHPRRPWRKIPPAASARYHRSDRLASSRGSRPSADYEPARGRRKRITPQSQQSRREELYSCGTIP